MLLSPPKKISRGARLTSPGRLYVEYLKHLFYSHEFHTFDNRLLLKLGSIRLGIKPIRFQQFFFHFFPTGILCCIENFFQFFIPLLSGFCQLFGHFFGVGTLIVGKHFPGREHGWPTATHASKSTTHWRTASLHVMTVRSSFKTFTHSPLWLRPILEYFLLFGEMNFIDFLILLLGKIQLGVHGLGNAAGISLGRGYILVRFERGIGPCRHKQCRQYDQQGSYFQSVLHLAFLFSSIQIYRTFIVHKNSIDIRPDCGDEAPETPTETGNGRPSGLPLPHICSRYAISHSMSLR